MGVGGMAECRCCLRSIGGLPSVRGSAVARRFGWYAGRSRDELPLLSGAVGVPLPILHSSSPPQPARVARPGRTADVMRRPHRRPSPTAASDRHGRGCLPGVLCVVAVYRPAWPTVSTVARRTPRSTTSRFGTATATRPRCVRRVTTRSPRRSTSDPGRERFSHRRLPRSLYIGRVNPVMGQRRKCPASRIYTGWHTPTRPPCWGVRRRRCSRLVGRWDGAPGNGPTPILPVVVVVSPALSPP